jgi:hypothetical protein
MGMVWLGATHQLTRQGSWHARGVGFGAVRIIGVEDLHLVLSKVFVGRFGSLAHICPGQWISQAKHEK